MDVRASFVTDSEAPKLMEPREGALHDPSVFPKAAPMFGVSFGENGIDVFCPELLSMWFGIVAPVALDGVGLLARTTRLSPDRGDRLDERNQLGDIMSIGRGENRGERNALRIRDDVVFRSHFRSIRGVRARLAPPKTARTDPESTTALDQSIWSASRSLPRRMWWSLSHTPASCHALRYRQQLIPDPHPISLGSISHGIPLRSTKRIPDKTLRRSSGLRPGYRRRRLLGAGRMGSMSDHSWSESSSFAMWTTPFVN